MPAKTHYEVLELTRDAAGEEVKHSFRQLIARYHPDKVQHLGTEFQAMAADRAAELTEAYRVLSDAGRRAEYDRSLQAGAGSAPAPQTQPPAASSPSAASNPPTLAEPEARERAEEPKTAPVAAQFKQERASRDEFVRKAAVGRVRQALEGLDGYDEAAVRGFDFACAPKAKLFGRGKGPRLLGKFVSRVDRESVADTWTQVGTSNLPANEDVCIILMGSAIAPPRELAEAITEQRRRARSSKVMVVPVDARNWDAHMPLDAPAIAKDLLARLKRGA